MSAIATETTITLPRDSNQALGIGQFACDWMSGKLGTPDESVKHRTVQFFVDSVLCGLSALAMQTNAPTVLRDEAHAYPRTGGATCFGSSTTVAPEKAIAANASAVREWDSNGTNFGYNPTLGHTAGEFGHNDFYAVPLAAAQVGGLDGAAALSGMMLLDEIRGRLAEVFSLKSYKIDHVVHGAIASAATWGAMSGATPEQIESAIGMVVAHYIPWRAIRAGKQLSDSKGASAAISTEVAVLAMQRSMRGFIGPKDIFRNPEAIWRQFEPTNGDSPFDLVLSHAGDDFAVMGMHFKLGLYEHQSAGALQGLIDLLRANPDVLDKAELIDRIAIRAYEPAFGIIGDPAKRDPHTRQSADHSMVYIVSTMLRKAIELGAPEGENDDWWKQLMLMPADYGRDAIDNAHTRSLMEKIEFEHGGAEYDARYPDGIPTSMVITLSDGRSFDSGLVMYPSGHARNITADLEDILSHKASLMGAIAVDGDAAAVIERFRSIESADVAAISNLMQFDIAQRDPVD
ncbi:MAG: MmgE/PrpD family protein [Phycisphaerales bacterium]|nr:MmgE/PrpD family protein [Phycisphaerales bacterium]